MKHIYTLEADSLFKRVVRHLFLIPISFFTGAVAALATDYTGAILGIDVSASASETGNIEFVVMMFIVGVATFAVLLLGLHLSAKACEKLGV
ncbi:exported hypothetical protein [Vibrio nigripulchritudo SO65]|uniref:hypothetical protein n=1 Tax=Vibrio nigripulchritudo TaxID=28173 RepID=UPI0003B1E2BF|nr:hypothetical protein [Vibrio nigripulchritudo]CCN37770.1 exported hypothetical protein [Vibrio nigripulchritudo AM115]CCN39976.1 exported hypothetical protein [Vibrio nigripulchritudo FTn2]CCN64775.1 exported hypothetical protein [Vibrio nigripulchritudo POn4]CCN78240.1 exported hypothetical protein [Vibrio nigripulchritudo SO65]